MNWRPNEVKYGRNFIQSAIEDQESFLVTTTEVPWNIVKKRVQNEPKKKVFVKSMERAKVENLTKNLPDIDTVIGIGGGLAIDMGKFVAWKKDTRLVTIPTVISADAMVTPAIAIRDDWNVRYIGYKTADKVFVDFDIIQEAPEAYNRGGAEDILSSYTALYDWKLASDRGYETYHENIAKKGEECLEKLEKNATEIKKVSEKGIKTLIDLYMKELDLCKAFGNSRPEEGSEHFFAYNLEYLTKRPYRHGPLVGLGIYLMAKLQNERQEKIVDLMDKIDLNYHPMEIDVARSEVRATLSTLEWYVEKERLPYTIINEKGINKEKIRELLEVLEF
ncbi:hypothetical protein AKJ57_05145 [candidate division MSBL1 archaeon SCGC-AAA259A05]|uniref:Alcohol dehydrogenase iron-type/glycerol dehydrogenase GldA domain-containing protein n=1 Tax=candidate division MSBL1 archaeon SCGC-AAA259A05 TaxID=1698259 RepID=A0A133U5W0_9EURY|nr:hypothetical protein AKJ57_05145 [candidate division MSBL1 archaeon SCGC-AAA259A05]